MLERNKLENVFEIGGRHEKITSNEVEQKRQSWQCSGNYSGMQTAPWYIKCSISSLIEKFHALKFAYIMEIIEEFGINVFNRIRKLSFPGLTAERLEQITIKDLEGANIP